MDIVKPRKEPILLTSLNILDRRLPLSYDEKQSIVSLKKGYEGEQQFDSLVKTLVTGEVLVLNDLLLTVKGKTLQIDSLIITGEAVHLYEVKNYRGSYQMKNSQLLTLSGQEIDNPLIQLERTTSLLRQLLQQWNIRLQVEPTVVHVNPSFTLYHADPKDDIILPTQIQSHFLNMNRQRNSLEKQHRYLAKRLINEHKTKVSFQKQLPTYEYSHLKKGLWCSDCGSNKLKLTQRSYQCHECNHKTTIDQLVLHHIKEFQLLFPDTNMTRNKMYDWCGEKIPKKRIRQVLSRNYNKMGSTLDTYYK